MSIFVNREGNISIVRVGTVAAVLGVVVLAGGFILNSLENRKFNSPLNIEIYPGAVEWGERQTSSTSRQLIYRVPGVEPEQVAQFYDELMLEFYDSNPADLDRPQCVRIPRLDQNNGIFADYQEGAGNLPYYFSCLFEEVPRFNSSRYRFTRVNVQPGVLNSATGTDTRGETVIEYEQDWD